MEWVIESNEFAARTYTLVHEKPEGASHATNGRTMDSALDWA